MPEKRKDRRWIYWTIAGVLLVVAVVVAIVIRQRSFDDDAANSKDEVPTSVEEKKSSSSNSSSASANATEKSETSTNMTTEEKKAVEEALKRPEQYGGESPNESNVLTGAVNYTGLNNGTLTIRTSIYQYLESGTCELVLMRGGNVAYQETVEIVAEATTSTCKGFDIPTTSLAGPAYSINIYLSSGNKTGVITGEVNL